MTDQRNFERLARAWLDLMPNEAPDRLIADVLQATETTPQERSRLGLVIRRYPPMNRMSFYAAAAAAILVIVVGAGLALRSSSDIGAPSVSPPGESGVPLPASLQHLWLGGHHDIGGIVTGAGTVISFDATSFHASQSNGESSLLGSKAAVAGDGSLLLSGTIGCPGGGTGRYTWTLSASGRQLSITSAVDTCSARQTALVGEWQLNACRAPKDYCLGDMVAGAYSSQYVRPRLGSVSWSPLYGGLTFTVPDGWANDSDWPNSFGLTPAADFEATSASEPDPARRIIVLTQVVPASQATPCSGQPQSGVAPTADAMVAWLRSVPGLVVGPSQPLTVDGLPAIAVDLRLDPATAPRCDTEQLVEYIHSGGDGYGIGASDGRRVVFVALGGELVAIQIEADQARFDAFASAAMPIIATFHFN